MEVVYLISRAKISGPINQALNILTGLNRVKGVHAVLMTMNEEIKGNSWLSRFIDAGIDVVQMGLPNHALKKSAKILRRYIQEHKVDIVHSSGYRADIVNVLAKDSNGTVSTQRCHPYVIRKQTRWFLRPFVYQARMLVIKRVDSVVACANSLQQEFKYDLRMNISAVQNGVNTDFFSPVDADTKRKIRNELQLPEYSRLYLVLGNIVARKNIGIIIDAFRKLPYEAGYLLIVGDGDLSNDMKKRAGSTPNIIFRSKTNVPVRYLQASDVLVSAALSEGLPNTVLEGLSSGLPCILSDIGPHKELIEGTEAGVLFTNNSSASLYQAFQLSTKWNLKQMSTVARNEAVNKHSIDCLAANYLTIYNYTINSK